MHEIRVLEIWKIIENKKYIVHMEIDGEYIVVIADKLDKEFKKIAREKGIKNVSLRDIETELAAMVQQRETAKPAAT